MWPWRRKRTALTCQQVVALVTDYLDGSLPANVRRQFEEHLDACLACPEYVEQIRVIALLAARPDPAAPAAPTQAEATELFRTLRGE